MAKVTIISVTTRMLAFVFKIFLSRKLGAEILGVYQITMSIFMLLISIPASGIPTSLSRYIAGYMAKQDAHSSSQILTTGLILSCIISLCLMVLFYSFPHLTRLLFNDERCLDMFYIMLPAILSTSLYSVIRSHFWGCKDFFIFSFTELMAEVVSIILIVLAIVLHLFSDKLSHAIAIAFVISDYIMVVLLVVIFVLHGGKLTKPAMLRPLIKSSLPMTSTRILGSMLSSMMALLIPTMLVRYGMPTEVATASYGRASGMVMPLVLIPSTIISALLVVIIPELASNKAKGLSLTSSVSNALRFTLINSCLFLAIFLAVGNEICTILYNDDIASQYVLVASLLIIPMSINQTAVSMLNTLGHENTTFITHMIGGIILSISIVIMPKYTGIYAYFISLIIFHTITCMVYLWKLNREISLDKRLTFMSFSLIFFTLAVSLAVKLLISRIHHNFITILGSIFIIVILYSIFVIKCKMLDIKVLKLSGKKLYKK